MEREAASSPAGTSPAAPMGFAITSCQRDPPHFARFYHEDVEDWLDQFTRVSVFNRWDDVAKLQNVGFSLEKVAQTWFLNNNHWLADWAIFCQELRQIFGRPVRHGKKSWPVAFRALKRRMRLT